MPGKILGLDISEEWITAVQVKSGLKGYQVTACARAKVVENGGLEGALKALGEQMDLKSDLCLASIPGAQVSYRNLQMPFKDPKKVRQTLFFELETMVPFPIDDLVVDFAIVDGAAESDVMAVSARKSYISEYLAQVRSVGIDPEVLDINSLPIVSWLLRQEGTPEEGAFLEIGERSVTFVLYLKRRIALIRTFGFKGLAKAQSPSDAAEGLDESSFRRVCTAIQNTIHAHGWNGQGPSSPEKVFYTGIGALYPETGDLLNRFLAIPAEGMDLSRDKRVRMEGDVARVWNPALMNGALALALRDVKEEQGFNFRKDEFEVRRDYYGRKKELKRVAVFLIVILSFLAADMGVDYYYLKKRYRMLDERITEVFKRTNPEVTRVVDPVQQMKVKINEKRKSAALIPGIASNERVLDLLMDISKRIPKSLDVRVTRMAIDPETVRMGGKTDTFNTVDSIKSGLEPSIYFSNVTISSANLDQTGKRVQFEIKLQRKR